MYEFELIIPNEYGHDLVDLEKGKVSADAEMATSSELQYCQYICSDFQRNEEGLTQNPYFSICLALSSFSNHLSGR